MVNSKHPQKGDLVWLNFSPQSGHEQKGRRPALVVSSSSYNASGLCLACPITSKKKGYPFEVEIDEEGFHGVILSDHVRNLDWKAREIEISGKISDLALEKVQAFIGALLIQD